MPRLKKKWMQPAVPAWIHLPNPDTVNPAADSTRRGKSLSRRTGQSGFVEVKNGYYRGRYLIDVPDQAERVRKAVILGLVTEMTKSEARRKLKSIIAAEGFNDSSYVIPVSEAFDKTVTRWRQNYLSRQKPSTQATMDYHLERYLLPKWGSYPVDTIKETIVNEWLDKLSHLAPSTQRGVIKTLQMALGRNFNSKLIHFPSKLQARRQHPCHSPEQMQKIIDSAREPYKTLFALLAETGLRAGEAYGLRYEDIDWRHLIIHVRRSVWRGKPQSTKSEQADRAIDIQQSLADMLLGHLNGRTSGWVFQTKHDTPFKTSASAEPGIISLAR
jgi:integrase